MSGKVNARVLVKELGRGAKAEIAKRSNRSWNTVNDYVKGRIKESPSIKKAILEYYLEVKEKEMELEKRLNAIKNQQSKIVIA